MLEPIVAFTVAVGLTFLLLLLVVYIALLAIRGPEHPLKRIRYEAGNPPKGSARIAVPPQYYGYALIFLVVDTVFVLLFLLVYAARVSTIWSLLAFIILVPPLAYALKHSRMLEKWV